MFDIQLQPIEQEDDQCLAAEYRVVKEAHALRGTRAPLPVLRPLVRAWTAVPALTAGAVRHAERVAEIGRAHV